jgi:hypothetical protein
LYGTGLEYPVLYVLNAGCWLDCYVRIPFVLFVCFGSAAPMKTGWAIGN